MKVGSNMDMKGISLWRVVRFAVLLIIGYYVIGKQQDGKEITRLNNAIPSSETFANEYLFVRRPLLIENYLSLDKDLLDSSYWTVESISKRLKDVEFRAGAAPYPKSTFQFGDEAAMRIFQFGTLPATFALGREPCLPVFAMKYAHTDNLHDDPSVACRLLDGMKVPSMIRKGAPLIPLGGIIIGSIGVETSVHAHEPAINLLIHGEKQWHIEGVRPFIQRAGDLVFIPLNFEHQVVNRQPSVGWTFQLHENHFGTQVGVAETERILNDYHSRHESRVT